jgi:hypothetical protein
MSAEVLLVDSEILQRGPASRLREDTGLGGSVLKEFPVSLRK